MVVKDSNFLYLILNLGSLSIPLLYSLYEKKFHFIQHVKKAFYSILFMAVFFLLWDIVYTRIGVWGFTAKYHLPYNFFGLPVEEWLFFFCIPYACLFTQEALKYYKPNFKLAEKYTKLLIYSLLILTIGVLIISFGKKYSTVNLILFILLLLYGLKNQLITLQYFFPSFLVILFPFFIVNGILTGTFILEPVVWYNEKEIIGIRILTIPIEDVFYAFNMLFMVQIIFDRYKKQKIC